MGEGHVILLANFYGSYLNKNKFRASVIVNNAGIEQLATLGISSILHVSYYVEVLLLHIPYGFRANRKIS